MGRKDGQSPAISLQPSIPFSSADIVSFHFERHRKIPLKKMIEKMKCVPFIILAVVFGAVKLYSQDLTWKEVVEFAKKNNPDLLSAMASVSVSQAKVKTALSNYYPQLTGNGSYNKSSDGSGGTQNQYAMNLTAQQSLFSGFKTKGSVESANAQLLGAESNLALVESQVFNDLRSAFINLFYAQEDVNTLTKIRDRKEDNKKLIELRYQGGRENLGTFLRAKAQLSQAQFELEQANRNLKVAQKGLARAMGQDDSSAYHLTGTFNVKMETTTPDFRALTIQTPSYTKSQFALMDAKASLVQSRSNYFPSLSVSGSGRRQGTDFPLDNDSWSVGANISYPFFSGGSDVFGVRQAKDQIQQSLAQLDGQRRQIELNLENAFANLQDAIGQVDVQKQFLESAEERAKIGRAQYNNGLVSYQDWDLIETDLTNSQKQVLSSSRDAALAEAAWLQVQGKGLEAIQ